MTASPITISIVTSVKNGEPYLGEAIESVRRQSYRHWDLLIVDAGSEDGSFERAEAAAAEDERIRVERRPGEPLYETLLYGLSKAKGDYLAWLNADDLYPTWSFASLADFAGRTGAQWITGLPACWDADGALKFVRARAWHPSPFIRAGAFQLHGLGFLQQESMFFSRALFEKLTQEERQTFASQKLAGDFYLWKTFAHHASLITAPTVLGGFRQHGNNLSAGNMDAYMDEVKALGAWTPPPLVGALSRRLYEVIAAIKTPKAVRQAEGDLSGGPAS